MTMLRQASHRKRWWLEVLAVVWLAWLYDIVANLSPIRQAEAVAHARSVFHIETVLHLDPELTLDRWMSGHHTLGLIVSTFYNNAHFIVTFGVLALLWWRHDGRYRPMRTALVTINVVGLIAFWQYPMAPPRLLPGDGIEDVVSATGAFGSWHSGSLAQHANEFAAMPSLHMAWAVWSAWGMSKMLEGTRWAKVVWLYPVLTGVTVLSTGNHFVADVVAGVLLGLVAVPLWERQYANRRRKAAASAASSSVVAGLHMPAASFEAEDMGRSVIQDHLQTSPTASSSIPPPLL